MYNKRYNKLAEVAKLLSNSGLVGVKPDLALAALLSQLIENSERQRSVYHRHYKLKMTLNNKKGYLGFFVAFRRQLSLLLFTGGLIDVHGVLTDAHGGLLVLVLVLVLVLGVHAASFASSSSSMSSSSSKESGLSSRCSSSSPSMRYVSSWKRPAMVISPSSRGSTSSTLRSFTTSTFSSI